MFAKREFYNAAVEAGLGEITFSLHGHTPELHDRLTGTPGAFHKLMKGMMRAIREDRIIVNVDVCINKQNVPYIDQIVELCLSVGVREFDLLHVIPQGAAFENRDELFYDPVEHLPRLQKVFRLNRHPSVVIWTNRFPVEFLEGLEDLIQDPHKMLDEVNGRRFQVRRYLDEGMPLECREQGALPVLLHRAVLQHRRPRHRAPEHGNAGTSGGSAPPTRPWPQLRRADARRPALRLRATLGVEVDDLTDLERLPVPAGDRHLRPSRSRSSRLVDRSGGRQPAADQRPRARTQLEACWPTATCPPAWRSRSSSTSAPRRGCSRTASACATRLAQSAPAPAELRVPQGRGRQRRARPARRSSPQLGSAGPGERRCRPA